jgi:hypothetical protein
MKADVIHGGDGAVHVSNADGLIAYGEFTCFIDGREFRFGGQFDVVGHGKKPSALSIQDVHSSKVEISIYKGPPVTTVAGLKTISKWLNAEC